MPVNDSRIHLAVELARQADSSSADGVGEVSALRDLAQEKPLRLGLALPPPAHSNARYVSSSSSNGISRRVVLARAHRVREVVLV